MSDIVKPQDTTDAGIERAQKAIESAMARRREVAARRDAADNLAATAAANRRKIVSSLLDADQVDGDLKRADEAIQDAQREAKALAEALVLADQAVGRAEGKMAALLVTRNRRRFRDAVKDYIAILEEGQELRQLIEEYMLKHKKAENAVHTAHNGAQIIRPEIGNWFSNHRLFHALVPVGLQKSIAQAGSAVDLSFVAHGRGTFNPILVELTRSLKEVE